MLIPFKSKSEEEEEIIAFLFHPNLKFHTETLLKCTVETITAEDEI